jgi:Fic family protein
MRYNWQQKDWPHFQYHINDIEPLLLAYLKNASKLEGALTSLNQTQREESIIELLIAEAIKTSQIEGEFFSRADIASSIRKELGLVVRDQNQNDRADGIARVLVSARDSFNQPLSKAMLFDWHAALLAHERALEVGCWRTHSEPMQIVSGPIGFEIVHFEAPPSSTLEEEMSRFIQWFNDTAPDGPLAMVHAPVRAAIAHLYFESIHPFEDGNGRMGRAVAEKALAQTTGFPGLASLSYTIEQNKKEYYVQLEKAQRSNDISEWIRYFVNVIVKGVRFAQEIIDFTLLKSKFFDLYTDQINAVQLKVIQRMFAEGPSGFEGGMTASKYSRLTRVSKATATRHLTDLAKLGAFAVTGQGRSTRYHLNLNEMG